MYELSEVFLAPIRDCFPAQVAIVSLLLLIALDWIFGIGDACMHHEFSSAKMREGIAHKCGELGFILVGVIADAMLSAGLDLGFNGPILTVIAMYMCVMEIGSLLEIFASINPNIAESSVFKLLASAKLVKDPTEYAREEGQTDVESESV